MKLVLANNQSERFVTFHKELQNDEQLYDYAGYDGLLFSFEKNKTSFYHIDTDKRVDDYDGVYLSGYMNTPEIAITAAVVLDGNGIRYLDSELHDAPSFSKLSAYAKLAAQGISIPRTYAGASRALRFGIERKLIDIELPVVLKRADADRGVDNYIFSNYDDVLVKLQTVDDRSLWILQVFVPNNGFYRVGIYKGVPKFSIFRTLEKRLDEKEELAHMYKPAGGVNAKSIAIEDMPTSVLHESLKAAKAMHREIAGVDVVVKTGTDVPYVLEVNYNPQLVTVSIFSDIRKQAFIDTMREL